MHRIVGPFVKMPPEQMLFCAISIGYGDRSHPANCFRAPPEEFCRFFGFDWALRSSVEMAASWQPVTCHDCDFSGVRI
jgi:hypothetical protein